MAQFRTAAAAAPAGELLVYVGPNLLRGIPDVLLRFQTFSARPVWAEERADLKALFVPLSGLAAARKELAVPGSRLFNAARAVSETAKTKESK